MRITNKYSSSTLGDSYLRNMEHSAPEELAVSSGASMQVYSGKMSRAYLNEGDGADFVKEGELAVNMESRKKRRLLRS